MLHLYRTCATAARGAAGTGAWVVVLGALVATVGLPDRSLAQTSRPAGARGYLVFFRGEPIGREDVTVTSDANGTTISSESRLSGIFNVNVRRAEVRYRPDWTTVSFALDAISNGGEITTRTVFADGTASTEGQQAGGAVSQAHAVDARTVALLPNAFFGAFEAVTRRLAADAAAAELRAYVVPVAEIVVRVGASASERMQIGNAFLNVRRHEVILANQVGQQSVSLTAAEDGSLIRVNIPSLALDVVRDDLAGSTSRTQVFTNPGDEAVTIPSLGFNLGATLTRPMAAPPRAPAVVLLGGSGIGDRDGVAFGVPTLAHLAKALSEAGFLVVRYDKRGNGQSGGRGESATLNDFAEDARVVFKWLEARRDVDPKRIALVGHSEGAWVALITAAREKRVAAVVSLAGASTTGADLVLEQQEAALAQSSMPLAEREARVALQKQIHGAILTGKGWEGVPEDLRRQADTPWFQSVLQFNPARVMKDVRAPFLVVHGALDKQVPVEHAERLADLARKVSDSKAIELTLVRGVNHLLVPAVTGEISEYATLPDRNVSADVTSTVSAWLTATFKAVK